MPDCLIDGIATITQMTGWPSLGVVPWLPQAAWLPAEDALDLDRGGEASPATRVIAVPMLSRIANFDDLDPLGMEPGVQLVFVRPGQPIPVTAAVIILPGTKSTLGDLAFLRAQGWDIDIAAHVRRGGHVLGLCGGYQMLGHIVADPDGIDGRAGTARGSACSTPPPRCAVTNPPRWFTESIARPIRRSKATRFTSAGPKAAIARGRC